MPEVTLVRYDGSINPVVAEFIHREVERANQAREAAFLLQLDTPGGLDSAMRTIIQALLGSEIPTIVHVYPPGARAASAGALIAMAADFAVMAPGTNIGAAHPVSLTSPAKEKDGEPDVMATKVLNDAVAYARSIAEQKGRDADWVEKLVRESHSESAQQAFELGVIDLVAEDAGALLAGLDGRSYRRGGAERRVVLANASILERQMAWHQQILNALGDPNIAYLLMMLGIVGIFFEISQPGVILPGAVGVLAILLALYAFQALPVSFVGVALILLGLMLFALEIKITSYGMLSLGGVLAFGFGSMMLIDTENPALRISPAVIFTCVAFSSLLILGCLYFVVRAQRRPVQGGREGMVGRVGSAVEGFQEHGRVFIGGEYWEAETEQPVRAGEAVEVVRIDGNLRLHVRPVIGKGSDEGEQQPDGRNL